MKSREGERAEIKKTPVIENKEDIDFFKVEIEPPLWRLCRFRDLWKIRLQSRQGPELWSSQQIQETAEVHAQRRDWKREDHSQRYPRTLWAGRTDRQDLHRDHRSAPGKHDGHRFRRNVVIGNPRRRRRKEAASSDRWRSHPGRRKVALILQKIIYFHLELWDIQGSF